MCLGSVAGDDEVNVPLGFFPALFQQVIADQGAVFFVGDGDGNLLDGLGADFGVLLIYDGSHRWAVDPGDGDEPFLFGFGYLAPTSIKGHFCKSGNPFIGDGHLFDNVSDFAHLV